MKAHTILTSILVGITTIMSAQEISFTSKTHDFDTIYSENGKVTHSFTFTNTGKKPLVLTRVKPGCGCTTTAYTKDSVAPGQTGFITAQFNPRGYNSRFKKTISVNSNAANDPSVILFIQGVVTSKDAEMIKKYRYEKGVLRVDKTTVNFGKIDVNAVVIDTLRMYNNQDSAISFSFQDVPEHVIVKYEPDSRLESKQEGLAIFTYDASKNEDFGLVRDIINIKFDGGRLDYRNRIFLSANLVEDFSTYSNWQLKRAPKVDFETSEFMFDTIQQGETVHAAFRFKNAGKKDLIIRKISTSCGCTAGELDEKVYSKNESGEIKVTFRSRGKHRNQRQRITVITNDPSNPTIHLYIKGYVQVP
ncbi:MAG: DUF1573 domain-containing protein [Bacteroidales bacterium]|jgi:hypothetical protein|nr:DUF1573 domain-containing protein [Bacteroidales bacterium]